MDITSIFLYATLFYHYSIIYMLNNFWTTEDGCRRYYSKCIIRIFVPYLSKLIELFHWRRFKLKTLILRHNIEKQLSRNIFFLLFLFTYIITKCILLWYFIIIFFFHTLYMYYTTSILMRIHAPSSGIVRIADRSNCHADLCHPRVLIWSCEVDERRVHGEKVKERGEGRRKGEGGGVAAAGAGRRYKEHYVQRRKTKWERDALLRTNGVRMNGEGGGGRRPRRRRGTMDTRNDGKKDEDRKERGGWREFEAQKSPLREATRKGRRLRSTWEKWTLRGGIVPAPYNVQSSRAGFSGIRCDAMQCRCYGTPRRGSIEQGFSLLLSSVPRRFMKNLSVSSLSL